MFYFDVLLKSIILFFNFLTLFFSFFLVWNFALSKLQDPPTAKNVAFTLLSACGKTLAPFNLLLHSLSLHLYLTDGALITCVSMWAMMSHYGMIVQCWQ